MDIEPMATSELEAAITAANSAGWGDQRPIFSFYAQHPHCSPFVAKVDGTVVGTAVAIQRGPVGWVGHVIVSPDYQRQGIGAALTRAASQYLLAQQCQSVLLIATEAGYPVYEKLGFQVETFYQFMKGQSVTTFPSAVRLHALQESDLPAICKLDREVTGEDRSPQLLAFAQGGVVLVGEQTQKLRGFFLPTPWGEGPGIALAPEDGCVLLEIRRAIAGAGDATEMMCAIPVENLAGQAYLKRQGFTDVRRGARMFLGKTVIWQPQAVWSRFSGAMG
ncbi:MAG TPA: GNAT family N-acetyltransferase [Ktedonobacterales bacterium]|nr:GNAT family N-acetyltransferase [Ktedonobacterales bacterium]